MLVSFKPLSMVRRPAQRSTICPRWNQPTPRPRTLPARATDNHPSYMLRPVTSDADLEAERAWLATAMITWLDEEWTILPEHQQLGQAAANAYAALRRRGEDDMGSLVLAVASELLRPDLAPAFRASFTDPFEVSNKLCETVMLRDGCDVCCTSAADKERIERVNVIMSSSSADSL